MNLDINMFGQTIKSGYMIKVAAWENDGDNYTYNVIKGLTKKEVAFYQEWLMGYISQSMGGMGNESFDFIKAMKHLFKLRDKYMIEIDSQLDIDLYDVDDIDLALDDKNFVEYNTDLLYNAIYGILGEPVRYENGFIRVFENIEIYHVKDDIIIPKIKKVKSIS